MIIFTVNQSVSYFQVCFCLADLKVKIRFRCFKSVSDSDFLCQSQSPRGRPQMSTTQKYSVYRHRRGKTAEDIHS